MNFRITSEWLTRIAAGPFEDGDDVVPVSGRPTGIRMSNEEPQVVLSDKELGWIERYARERGVQGVQTVLMLVSTVRHERAENARLRALLVRVRDEWSECFEMYEAIDAELAKPRAVASDEAERAEPTKK